MLPRHKLVLRYDLLGKSKSQIASLTGYMPSTVENIKSRKYYKAKKKKMENKIDRKFIEKAAEDFVDDPVRAQLEESKSRAMELLVLMAENAESENVKLKAIRDILDRAGYKPTKEIKQETDMKISLDDRLGEGVSEALNDLKQIRNSSQSSSKSKSKGKSKGEKEEKEDE